jgi:hypothetical protein
LVEDALRRGEWGKTEASAFRTQLGQVDGEGRDSLLRELIPAINEGRLRVRIADPAF